MRKLSLLLAAFVIFSLSLPAQVYYSGILKKIDDSLQYSYQLDWESLLALQVNNREKGFELADVEAIVVDGQTEYNAIWQENADEKRMMLVPGWDSLVILKREMAADSFVITDVEAFSHKGEEFFVVLWKKGTTYHKIRKLTSWEGLKNDYEELNKRKLEMMDIEGFTAADGKTHYLALYHKRFANNRTHLYRASDYKTFSIDKGKRNKSGYQLFDYEHFEKRGVAFYVGLYHKSNAGGYIIEADSQEAFAQKCSEFKNEKQLALTDLDVNNNIQER